MSVLEFVAPAAPPAPRWTKVSSELWVASTPLQFMGTVERIDNRFVACDRYAIPVGNYSSLGEAKRQITDPAPVGVTWGATFVAAVALISAVTMIAWGVNVA